MMIILTILGVGLIGLLINYVFFRDIGENYCEIIVDGSVTETVTLANDRTFSIAERPHIVFEIKDHRIAFIKSDCPDKVCIHSGYQGHNGQSASCLPNKTTIVVHSRNKKADEPDLVVKGLRPAGLDKQADGGKYEE